jgi:hypothetical protein
MVNHFGSGPAAVIVKGIDGLKRTYSGDGQFLFDGDVPKYGGPTFVFNERGVPQKRHKYHLAPNVDRHSLEYDVLLTEDEHRQFDDTVSSFVVAGVHINPAKGLLHAAAVAALEQPERIVEQIGSIRNDPEGLTVNARRCTNFYVEVVGEAAGNFRLRTKMTGEDEFRYFDVPTEQFHMGNFAHYVGANARNYLGCGDYTHSAGSVGGFV